MIKVIGFLLMASALYCFWLVADFKEEVRPSSALRELVVQDLKKLRNQGHLPAEWASLKKISYFFESKEIEKKILYKLPIQAHETGRYLLELEFFEAPDESEPKLILQMSLVDLETNNKAWELGRTYSLKETLPKTHGSQK